MEDDQKKKICYEVELLNWQEECRRLEQQKKEVSYELEIEMARMNEILEKQQKEKED